MTPEKAIEILSEVSFLATDEQSKEIEEAIQMAIECLENYDSLAKDFEGAVELIRKKNEKIKALTTYECDPNKNTLCRKSFCYVNGGECHRTSHKEFSK